jgi:hypothetical protein
MFLLHLYKISHGNQEHEILALDLEEVKEHIQEKLDTSINWSIEDRGNLIRSCNYCTTEVEDNIKGKRKDWDYYCPGCKRELWHSFTTVIDMMTLEEIRKDLEKYKDE